MPRLLLEPGHHGVVVAVRPADVDAREEEAGDDDPDAEQDAERDAADALGGEDVALERDEEDEAVVDDQGHGGELDRDPVLPRGEVLELGILEELQVASMLVAHEGGILPK